MSKCEQCIVRQFSSLKALNKEELLQKLYKIITRKYKSLRK